MKKSRFSESKIVSLLKEHEQGRSTQEICREHGISAATFYNWRKKEELEEENNALEQEHLVMLKKQDQMGSGVNTENSEMSTMAETKLNMDES